MTPQEKANWIRRIFALSLILIAAGAGLYSAMPDGWWKGADKEEERVGVKITKENRAQILASPNKLTVINMMVEDSKESEKLREILKKLQKEKYGDKVTMAELDVEEEPELAELHGVKKEGFAGQLDFYANNRKLEALVGQTDPAIIEQTIDRLMAGLLQRISKDWLPEVPGMQRVKGQGNETPKIQSAKPSQKP